MGIINLLDIQTANLIAAGEVVERPASAVKELCENSIDAGAKNITVEIKNGGNTYIRVSDDGSGISDDDLPKTVLRHATSKIKTGDDLDGVLTLGFRGEALAAIASVSRLQIISKKSGETMGRTLISNDTDGVVISEAGCPSGTSVIARDLFYNVPARKKFMKRDATEAAAVGAVVEKLALSHPELCFRFISDDEQKLSTGGDGKLMSTIYSVYGRSFAETLEEVCYQDGEMSVNGFVSKPSSPRASRSMQSFFINNRYIKSRTVTAALEEAYSSYIPRGKFPAAILLIKINPKTIDVNVHPSKAEVKFSEEKKVFDLVYYAVKSVLASGPDKYPEFEGREASPGIQPSEFPVYTAALFEGIKTHSSDNDIVDDGQAPFALPQQPQAAILSEASPVQPASIAEESRQTRIENTATAEFKFIGELYNAYAVVETPAGVYLIDKHAAHERILYEDLKASNIKYAQQLFVPIEITLEATECAALKENAEQLLEYGFEFKIKGNTLILTAIPDMISRTASAIPDFITALAEKLKDGDTLSVAERTDRALFTIACKAALKAGVANNSAHTEWVIRRVMTDERISYCPHGRPVFHIIERRELDRFFDR